MSTAAPLGDLAETNLSIAIALPLPDNVGLQKFLAERHDPTSTNYNRSLPVDEFVARFSPTEQQYQNAIKFAEKRGLKVTSTYKNRQMFNAVGSVADVEKLFHVKMKRYQHPKENRKFFAPDRDPSVDAGFDILEVHGLENFYLPHPLDLHATPFATNSVTSFGSQGSAGAGLLTAIDLRNAYVPGVTLRGEGQSIALLQFLPYWSDNIRLYEKLCGFNINVTNISVNGFSTTPAPGTEDGEQTLDITVSAAMAPAARIMVYEGNDMASMFNAMASDGVARQVSCSWGQGAGVNQAVVNAIDQLQAQGESVFIASGDNGAYKHNADLGNPGGFPNVTICGGTILTMTQSGGGALESEVVWTGSGGGICTNFSLPTYQQGMNMAAVHGSTTFRNVPDVCGVSINFAGFINQSNVYTGIAGTSGTAPIWAGYMALINEQIDHNVAAKITDLNTSLYNIAKGPNYSAAFRDITTGNNTNAVSPTDYFAGPGYDLVTGWGSPNGTNLINLLAASTNRLKITPGFGFSATKVYGGSAPATSVTFLLTNTSSTSMPWTAAITDSWISVTNAGGTIPAFKSTNVTVFLTGAADSLALGTYTGTVTFTDVNTNVKVKRLCSFTVSAAAQPLALTGYNASVIVPNTGTKTTPGAVAFGTGSTYSYYQAGLAGSTHGLPLSGRFISGWDGQTVFQLAPYTGNNTLLLGTGYATSGTLTLSTPKSLSALVVLAASAYGDSSSTGQVTVRFSDNSTRVFTYNAPDWFYQNSNAAIGGLGRVDLTDFSLSDVGDEPRMYQTFIPLLLDSTKTVTSLTFTNASGVGNTGIFAVSGVATGLSGLTPSITQQPQSFTNGDVRIPYAFMVSATGAPPLSYQWYSNSVAVPNGVQQALGFDRNVPTNFAGTYYVVVSNLFGSVQSAPATMSVIRTPPTFIQQPAITNYTVFAGQTISFTSVATSPLTISYTWQLNGSSVAGATNTTLALSNLQLSDAGTYTLVAGTTAGYATNNAVSVNVVPRPSSGFPQALLQAAPASYWRLDETNGGIAHDYMGVNSGVYTNVVLGKPGSGSNSGTGTEPSELAAQFGPTNGAQSRVIVPSIDLSAANGNNGLFSVSAWVLASNNVVNGAGIVTKGSGNGDEQFCLDCGGGVNAFRFFVRNALNGAASGAASSVLPDNRWHFLVGVCDQVHGIVALYVDGTNAAQASISANIGIRSTSIPMTIGARMSGSATPYDFQLLGLIDDVVIFTNALSGSQILSLYNTARYSPVIQQQPTAQQKVCTGSSATLQVGSTGTNLGYQWYGPAGALNGATNSSLTLTNLQLTQRGYYYVNVTNNYGMAQSANAWVIVLPSPASPYPQSVLALNPLAYWRLNETSGSIAYDFANNNDGTYNNVVLGQPGYDSNFPLKTDPGELAAQFVSNGLPSLISIPTIDLWKPNSGNGQFSIAAWVKADPTAPNGAPIISKGPGSAHDELFSEQFMMDCGGPGNAFRFAVCDEYLVVEHAAVSSVVPDGLWHLLVGVCNQNNQTISFYIDGTNAASTTIPANQGIFICDVPAAIGSRHTFNFNHDNTPIQFKGVLNDIAIFNSALSGSQVATLYRSAIGPVASTQPASQVTLTTAQLNGQANPDTVSTVALFQWGTTSNYGNTTAWQDIGSGNVDVGFNATLNGLASGTTYHYQAVISNQFGVFLGGDAVFATLANAIVFGGSGLNWYSNQSGAYTTPPIANNVLKLTDGASSEARSVFFQQPQYIGAFKASFTYQDVGGGGADGAAFILQNDPRGVAALGGAGGSLGYGAANPITPSAALELNIYNGNSQIVGYAFLINGLTGIGGANGNYHTTGALNLASGHPIDITMNYADSWLALNFTDAVAGVSFSTNLNVGQLASKLGGQTAYIGFSGGAGSVSSTQVITGFSFVSIPTLNISLSGGNLAFTWPASIAGYGLQMSTTLLPDSWTTLGNQPTVVNGQNQIILPVSNVKTFYRLSLQ
jgi:hypothetical protein